MTRLADFNRALRVAAQQVAPVYKTKLGQGPGADAWQYVPAEDVEPVVRKALHDNGLHLSIAASGMTADRGSVKITFDLSHDSGHTKQLEHEFPMMEISGTHGAAGLTQRYGATLRHGWCLAASRLLAIEIRHVQTEPRPASPPQESLTQGANTGEASVKTVAIEEVTFDMEALCGLVVAYNDRERFHAQAEGHRFEPLSLPEIWRRMMQSQGLVVDCPQVLDDAGRMAVFYWLLEDQRRCAA